MNRMKKALVFFLLGATLLTTAFGCAETGKKEGNDTATPTEDSAMQNQITEDRSNDSQISKASVPSRALASMLSAFSEAGLSMHSVLVMRHGEVVAECYAPPFDENSLHRMYSVSKSFVGMSVGLLLSDPDYSHLFPQGIDTKIGDLTCFSDLLNPSTDERIKNTKIVDLLRMAAPFPKGSTYDGPNDMNWLATFFDPADGRKPDHDAGTGFHYDTSASYLLGVMVERITGMTFLEYLKRNALHEIGFSENSWCVEAPEGYAWGGSGVMCTTRDIAAFAYLVMRGGNWNGKQLLPADYVRAATSYQIAIPSGEDDNCTGYGYQIWITDFGFAFLGMGCQLAFCVPSMDLVFACTADNQGYQKNGKDDEDTVFEIFRRHLLAKLTDGIVTETSADRELLNRQIAAFGIPAQKGSGSSPLASTVSGKTYSGSGAAFFSFRLTFEDASGTLFYTTSRGDKELRFGLGENLICLLDEPQYSGRAINHPNGKGYRALCSGAWTDRDTFVLWVQVCDDYFGNMKMTFDFSGEKSVTVTVTKTAEWFLEEYKMKKVEYTGN